MIGVLLKRNALTMESFMSKIFAPTIIAAILMPGVCAIAQSEPAQFPPLPPAIPMSDINFSVSAEKWIKTSTAKVTVNLNAVIKQAELANINSQIMTTLNQLVENQEWHVTQFNRSQDSSGMERIYVTAEARISENLLSNLNTKALQLSREGRTLRIQDIQFTPTLAERENVRAEVRKLLYDQVKQEVARLNSVYSTSRYQIKTIDFQSSAIAQPMLYQKQYSAEARVADMAAAAPAIEVSDKIVLSAYVVLSDKLTWSQTG